MTLIKFLAVIEDPRIDRHKHYPLINILVFTFVALLSDQLSWYQIHEFCLTNIQWFSELIDVSSGVPSHDTFRRVIGLIDTEQLEKAIVEWIESTREKTGIKHRVIALDGKSLRGVAWKVNDKQLHILNAWDATEDRFIGQLTIESKTNEISAALELIGILNVENTVITVDAIMTQKEIAKAIVSKRGDYVMALKGNQGTLFKDTVLYFSENQTGMSHAQSIEKNRGQVEIRFKENCLINAEANRPTQNPHIKAEKSCLLNRL